ncbi:MAG TPA: Minf_1886 family protein [Planctomycetaceae bacterium]|jgi:uncharacterized repeat protein (TIGR04138 family)
MSTTQKTSLPRLKYHPNTERFLFEALRRTQRNLGRLREGRLPAGGTASLETGSSDGGDQQVVEQQSHISGPELLEGIREFALEEFGLLARTVFHCWSIHTTEDFGRVVFDLIERHEMSKTDGDQLSDFIDVYDFEEALDNQYRIDVSRAFS